MYSFLRQSKQAVLISVHVTLRAPRDEVLPAQGGPLRVRLHAAPVEGAANAALLQLLARRLDVHHTQVEIVGGWTSRNKLVAVQGLDIAEVHRRLSASA